MTDINKQDISASVKDKHKQRVILNIVDHIAYVSLNRPEKHNGLDEAMIVGLIQTAKAIKKNHTIRCVILKGEGASFCSGLDFSYLVKHPSMIARFFCKLPWRKDNVFQRVALVWRDLPIPVIASMHGNCFGAGVQLALGCDFRFATPDTKLSIMEIKWGLIPDMSATATLSRLTRVDIAQELTMTGRFFSGAEALEYGLVTRISRDPLAQAQELALQLVEKSPDAISAAKKLFTKTWQKDTRAALFWERFIQLGLLGRKNQRIAMKQGLKKKQSSIEGQKSPFQNRGRF
ncbi:MAG: crotonase/enoyl-CoA hydratase family protein [Colwellia sp.]